MSQKYKNKHESELNKSPFICATANISCIATKPVLEAISNFPYGTTNLLAEATADRNLHRRTICHGLEIPIKIAKKRKWLLSSSTIHNPYLNINYHIYKINYNQ